MILNKEKGFTLIELLVVIAIIGILSSVVLASLNTARQKSRDVRRISDVKQLQLALEFHFDSFGSYPDTLSTTALVDTGYMAQIPTPPTGSGQTAYAYSPLNVGCTGYHLGAVLEDPGHQVLNSDIDADGGTLGSSCLGPDTASPTPVFNGNAGGCIGPSPTTDECYDVSD